MPRLTALGALAALASLSACRDAPGSPSVSPVANAPSTTSDPRAVSPSRTPFVPEKITAEGRAMGTHLAFAAFTKPDVDADRTRSLFDAAIVEIRRLEKLMTTWDPSSEVSRINASAGIRPVAVSDETFTVIAASLRASAQSDGAFDITFETLHGLWKFDEDLDPHPPTSADVHDRLRFLGFQHVKTDAAARTVFLDERRARIGLGGIAKGYAVDRASKVLEDGGLTSYYVQAGGDLYAHGTKPDGASWQAGVRDPRGPEGDYFAMLPLSNHAFSTAGDYERSYIVDGKRYHHIIDPHTGYPATASRSVTIWAPSALVADAVDDSVFILGPEKGLALVESLDGVGAVIVDAHNRVWISKRLEGQVEPVHPPTDKL
jgi:FAD:protein FMN transferase